MPYLIRHTKMKPPMYLTPTGSISGLREQAAEFPTLDDAVKARESIDSFAYRFEIIPKLEVAK